MYHGFKIDYRRGHVQFTKLMINASKYVCGLKADTAILCYRLVASEAIAVPFGKGENSSSENEFIDFVE